MTDSAPVRSLATLLDDLKNTLPDGEVSFGMLAEALHERGIAMLLMIIAAPMALPIPVPPGINIMLASPLVLLTAQQMMGAHTVWLPQKMRDRTISGIKLKHMLESFEPWARRIEILVKPRLGWITQDGPSRLCGFLGLLMALTVCIPLPLTNTAPSFGIVLMSIGVIMRDGLAVIAGALFGMGWIIMLSASIIIFGPEAFDIIKETIKSWL